MHNCFMSPKFLKSLETGYFLCFSIGVLHNFKIVGGRQRDFYVFSEIISSIIEPLLTTIL